MLTHDEIIEKAWKRYYSEGIKYDDYTKYDALYDTVRDLSLHNTMSDEEYNELMEEMQYQ